MEFTPDTAFSAAQILAVLLVATILDPGTKDAVGDPATPRRRHAVGTWASYLAKVVALVVLLFDMQLVLFDNTWQGGRAVALALMNYVAIVSQAFAILYTVLNHMGARREQSQGAA